MSGTWGNNIKVSIFGESHGKAIGVVIDGIMPGIELDLAEIQREMSRRAPGRNSISTSRFEKDEFNILSGYFNGRTTGTPLSMIIYNNDQKSRDYEKTKDLMRPGHGDFTGYVKYKGFNDYRGGGHFSGRITAPLVFAGALCKQILKSKGVTIGAHVKSIGLIEDEGFDYTDVGEKLLYDISHKGFPVINDEKGKLMEEHILEAKKDMDSVGGIIECAAINIPAGLGDPFFDSVESTLAHILFSIPGVKGVEFGKGFDISRMKGSKANDEYYVENGIVKTYTNNNGGILGGITNGMPIIFRTAMKPTPSIGKKQRTINISSMKDEEILIQGRHDPCIAVRAVPVIEAAAAIALLDVMEGYRNEG